jgi:DNA polymerase-3 subunit alpha
VSKRLEGMQAPRGPQQNGDGEISIIALLGAGAEVEVKLPGRYKVSPQIAGALKAVPGVVEVQAI